MKIGTIDIGPRPLLLAPMEDVTDIGFRLLCRRLGAAMVYSEFVAADALVRLIKPSLAKLRICDEERPVAVQIYGKDPVAMADAAQIVYEQAHPDVLDINFGCPVKRVAGKGAGAGLLQNVPLLLDIARRVADAVPIPVTAKTRLGWDMNNLIIPTLAEQLQDTGIAALTIHGRTRSQMYTGQADWTLIGEVKSNPRIHIPIIGNGDITTPEAAREAFERYGVDAVMIGRATFGRPWVFAEIRQVLDCNSDNPSSIPPTPNGAATAPSATESTPSAAESNPSSASIPTDIQQPPYPITIPSSPDAMSADWKLDVLKQQVLESVSRIDEKRGILHVRRHLAATPLFKGIPDFRQKRIAILRAETVEELFRLLEEVRPLVRTSQGA